MPGLADDGMEKRVSGRQDSSLTNKAFFGGQLK